MKDLTLSTYNGWATYETWNAALWIQNEDFLYNIAVECVQDCGEDETPWDMFVRCMMQTHIGRFLGCTGDGVAWDSMAIDADEMNELLADL